MARRIRSFRTQLDMTQEQLARAAKVTPKFVSQIENGHVNPSIGVLRRLVEDGLSLPLSTFFGSSSAEDVIADVRLIVELLGDKPVAVRRRAIRVIRAMLAEDENEREAKRSSRRRSSSSPPVSR